MLTLLEHLISPLVFFEVNVVLSFVSPYFMLQSCLLILSFDCSFCLTAWYLYFLLFYLNIQIWFIMFKPMKSLYFNVNRNFFFGQMLSSCFVFNKSVNSLSEKTICTQLGFKHLYILDVFDFKYFYWCGHWKLIVSFE